MEVVLEEALGFGMGIVIFTPPYMPACQPIENIWGIVKTYVKEEYVIKRTVTNTIRDVWRGMYGGTSRHAGQPYHEGITPEMAQKTINSMWKYLNELILRDKVLSGTITNLVLNADYVPPSQLIINLDDTESEYQSESSSASE